MTSQRASALSEIRTGDRSFLGGRASRRAERANRTAGERLGRSLALQNLE